MFYLFFHLLCTYIKTDCITSNFYSNMKNKDCKRNINDSKIILRSRQNTIAMIMILKIVFKVSHKESYFIGVEFQTSKNHVIFVYFQAAVSTRMSVSALYVEKKIK